jgi:hypothetical protein
MASGDTQRSWFPEMLEELNRFWSGDVSWEEIIIFAHHMTEERKQIKKSKNIKPIQNKCRTCGSQLDLPPISIRSCLFALLRINRISEKQFKQLENEWKKQRKQNGLDAFGNKF